MVYYGAYKTSSYCKYRHNEYYQKQALRRQWFAGVRGEWTKGCSLPMTISEEESNSFCACH
jgi:hypothetical protein